MALKLFTISMKAQMMSILVLLMFLLMLATLFTFAMLNVSNNNIEQSLSLASGTSGYSSLLKLSANNFAEASAAKALQVLANYELTPSMRKDNFITNMSLYLSQLMENGTVPNETQAAAANTIGAMGNLTFKGYNSIVSGTLGFSVSNLSINETVPRVFQTSPYAINIAYVENIAFTASHSRYKYSIPVNVSLQLNGTPDLMYAQRGIARNIRFASLNNITSTIADAHATTGNYIGIAYGTVLALPSNSISGASCPSSTPLPANDIIIATYNAIGLESCMNSYAGLVSYIAPTSTPTVPYLIYSSGTNILQQLPTGKKVLIYGPELAVMNIENLKNAISNGYYFASPFTPSYIDRASWNLMKSSPNGIFTFSNYNTHVAQFNGVSSYIQIPNANSLQLSTTTFGGWVNYKGPTSGNWDWLIAKQNAYGVGVCGSSLDVCFYNWGTGTTYQSSYALTKNTWYYLIAEVVNGNETVYVNGNKVIADPLSVSSQSTVGWQIGYGNAGGQLLNGSAGNIQIYNTSLSVNEIQQLYQEGIGGAPLANAGLVGWWPLNGNANDYSGNGNNGTATNIAYVSPANYTRDSILVTTTPKTQPLPGIGSCTSNANCNSNTMANLFISNLPLENKPQYVSYSTTASQQIIVNKEFFQNNSFTILGWEYWPSGVNLANPGTSNGDLGYAWSGPTVGDEGFGIFSRSDHWYLNFYADDLECSAGPTAGRWYQFGATWNNKTKLQTIWVNGVANCTRTSTGYLTTNSPLDLLSASGTWDGNAYANGYVSNIQIYNTFLSASQIQALYSEGIYGAPIDLQNLVGWWPLNGNANDYSGNGNNGTATNVVYYPINGTYTAQGLSSLNGIEDELESLGFVG
ncbi:MAG: LamG-like jellyroll fold domain-containing protein [Candidatus Micrarchaeaceae archaeon]